MWTQTENPTLNPPVASNVVPRVVARTADDRTPVDQRPQPLRIVYTTTTVLAGVATRMMRLPGVVKQDRSELSEAFRMLRNRLLPRMRADGFRVLAVTSPRASPGKTLTALNLALTMAADHNTSALLIDADLTRRDLQALLGLGNRAGLAEHLSAGTPLPGLLLNPGVDRLVVLPAGASPIPDSAEWLASNSALHLMAELKSRYSDRIVLVDLPPLLDSADALALLPGIDTTLLVVEDHVTTQSDLEASAQLLAPFNVVGTVVCPSLGPSGGNAATHLISDRASSSEDAGDARRPWYRRWAGRLGRSTTD